MFYVIGLGNPGKKYQDTRHNIGRRAVNYFGEQNGFTEFIYDKNANAQSAKGQVVSEAIECLLPETFMNNSGDTVRYLFKKKNASREELIIVHDDIDLPLGEVRIGKNRGGGGNNGVDSVINALDSKDFVRIRIGIAPKSLLTGKTKRPAGGGALERFVLKSFSFNERHLVPEILKKVSLALGLIILEGVDSAMNKIN